ncbi:MAG TPA: flagellar hook-associated protein FlgL [Stellaceae bacterium]|jgi:flagellar hook-associated protein 3 FlgL
MQISTSEFLLGSLNDMLNQQQKANTLNTEIATGQTLLDASDDPAGAAKVLNAANLISQYKYDQSNAQAATQSLQNGVAALQQVTNLLTSLQQTALQAADTTTTTTYRQSLVQTAQGALAQLVQLANVQGANGQYLFSGTNAGVVPYSMLPNGQVVFNGDAGTNEIQIGPSLSVPSSMSGSGIFTNIPAGVDGVTVSADTSNSGDGYAVVGGITNISQLASARLAGTQYEISFATAPGGSLTYTVASGTGAPGSSGFTASSGIVSSGAFNGGSDLTFSGIDVRISGSPSAGDSFDVQAGATTSMFQTIQDLISALQTTPNTGNNAQLQQQVENVIANLTGAQTSALSAQASYGSSLQEIQSVQSQVTSLTTTTQAQLANVQSANLPQVMANYSESITALQASEEAFAKVQGLSLFDYIQQ